MRDDYKYKTEMKILKYTLMGAIPTMIIALIINKFDISNPIYYWILGYFSMIPTVTQYEKTLKKLEKIR